VSPQVLETKPLLKEALQAEVGLPIDPSTPLIGFIGRLEEQKGSDILAGAVGDIVNAGAQLVVLVSLCLSFFGTLFVSCPLEFHDYVSCLSFPGDFSFSFSIYLARSIFSGAAGERRLTSLAFPYVLYVLQTEP
jgi:hypothetical protein